MAERSKSHHMPSQDALKQNGYPTRTGASVSVPENVHYRTGSYGSSPDSVAFRAKEIDLLAKGDYAGAQDFGIQDFRSLQPDGEDEKGIQEMIDYPRETGWRK